MEEKPFRVVTFPWLFTDRKRLMHSITGWVHSSHLTMSLTPQGKCFPCADKCPLMGHNADKFTVTDGISKKYFLNTGRSKPFGRKYPALPFKCDLHISRKDLLFRFNCIETLKHISMITYPVLLFLCFQLNIQLTKFSMDWYHFPLQWLINSISIRFGQLSIRGIGHFQTTWVQDTLTGCAMQY